MSLYDQILYDDIEDGEGGGAFDPDNPAYRKWRLSLPYVELEIYPPPPGCEAYSELVEIGSGKVVGCSFSLRPGTGLLDFFNQRGEQDRPERPPPRRSRG